MTPVWWTHVCMTGSLNLMYCTVIHSTSLEAITMQTALFAAHFGSDSMGWSPNSKVVCCIYNYIHLNICVFIEGNLEVKLPTYGRMQQQRWEQSEKRKRKSQKRERVREKTVSKKKRNAQKGRNVAKHYAMFFVCFRAREGRKVGSLKQRVRSHLVGWEIKNCTPPWREAHCQVKRVKAHRVW